MKDVLFYPSVCLPLVTTTKMPPFCFSNVLWRVAVVKEEHQENTFPLIMVLFGITFDTKEHPQNAHSSMVVMLFGKAIEVKEQEENTHSLIVVIPSLITASSICSLSWRLKSCWCLFLLNPSIIIYFPTSSDEQCFYLLIENSFAVVFTWTICFSSHSCFLQMFKWFLWIVEWFTESWCTNRRTWMWVWIHLLHGYPWIFSNAHLLFLHYSKPFTWNYFLW